MQHIPAAVVAEEVQQLQEQLGLTPFLADLLRQALNPDPTKPKQILIQPRAITWQGENIGRIWPMQLDHIILPPAFGLWLSQQRNLGEGSLSPNTTAVKRFLGIFKAPADMDLLSAEFMGEVYKQDMVGAARNLPLLNPKHSCCQKMPSAIGHWVSWHLAVCNRQEDYTWTNKLNALNNDLVGWQRKCSEAHDMANMARKLYDANRIAKMKDADGLKEAAVAAMLRLRAIATHYQGRQHISMKALGEANTALVGVIWCCTWAGRDYEWKIVTKQTILDILTPREDGSVVDHLVCTKHKTCKELGEAVKWLSPPILEGLRCYVSLPLMKKEKASDLFWRPVKGKEISVQACLRTFGAEYLPGTQPPGVNLMRKRFTTDALEVYQNAKVLSDLKDVDKHGEKTAAKSYAAYTWQRNCEKAKQVYQRVMGEVPSWPTDEVLAIRDQKCGQLQLKDGPAEDDDEDYDE